MKNSNPANSGIQPPPRRFSRQTRVLSFCIFAIIMVGFSVLFAASKKWINLRLVFGQCGFQQRFQLPCPGCGWTHSSLAFVQGRIGEAFGIQPAAAVFCLAAIVIALFALHIAIFGVDFKFLKWLRSPEGIKIWLFTAIVVVLGGWAVTFVRAIIEREHFSG